MGTPYFSLYLGYLHVPGFNLVWAEEFLFNVNPGLFCFISQMSGCTVAWMGCFGLENPFLMGTAPYLT